jgi:hypothetical protein
MGSAESRWALLTPRAVTVAGDRVVYRVAGGDDCCCSSTAAAAP